MKPSGYATVPKSAPAGYVVRLEPGVWLRRGDGDPPRTYVLNYAAVFESEGGALRALKKARSYGRPFALALVLPVNLELAS